jgi:hypothetical protein
MAGPVAACGGLIGPNGAVNLLRTTTFVGYHAGVEHYVTAFAFAGGGGRFGSITPLPGVPSTVERGGDWTLQRLIRETQPVFEASDAFLAKPAAAGAEVLLQTRIDALDITVLRGGGRSGPGPRPMASASARRPEVLDFYAERSPIFLAASFDATPRPPVASRSGTARRSTSRSRRRTRGSRSGSSAWARRRPSGSRPTSIS